MLRTVSVSDTMKLYQRMTRHILNTYRSLRAGAQLPGGAAPLVTWDQWRADAAKANQTTVHDVWARLVCSVPGVGPETAEAVVKAFPVPVRLFRALEACQHEATRAGKDAGAECVKMLAAVQISAVRKVGNRAATNIWTELFKTGMAPCV